ncbi:MAG: alkaline shock response membrane anchor protein AmaP [Candidatus Aceula meridiana]|nr:alkaline shock response membrane anchor protein AmaP [Candidatus Aceula meridiana]
MKFFKHLGVLFYLIVILAIGGIAILFASQGISFADVNYYLGLAYHDASIRVVILGMSVIIMLLSLIFAKVILGGGHKERTIAFENPSGRVSISLSALEDTVRRAVLRVVEVKEMKPAITATKKGIEISCRLILRSEASIPDMTSRLQEIIKERIQDALGIEENVIVRIHITKIISELSKGKKEIEEEPEGKEQLSVPFRYRK